MPQQAKDKSSAIFRRALFLSVGLHLLLFVFEVPQQATALQPVEVTLLQPELVTERIVSPPATKSSEASKNTKFKSDFNSIAEREQLKRGLPDAGPGPSLSQPKSRQIAPQPEKKVVAKKMANSAGPKADEQKGPKVAPKLTLNPTDLAQTLASVARSDNEQRQNETAAQDSNAERERLKSERQLSQHQPFSSSSFSSLFRGQTGTADYLPEIPDGDITLLNAKADQYAVFVRRVAGQVFGAIRRRNWQELSFGETQNITHFVTVEAVMTKDGKMKSVRQLDSSGSIKFDQILKAAANEGAWDQNPPKGAESDDGNIHFIFKSRTWARRVGDARFEQRWLLLGTGLL